MWYDGVGVMIACAVLCVHTCNVYVLACVAEFLFITLLPAVVMVTEYPGNHDAHRHTMCQHCFREGSWGCWGEKCFNNWSYYIQKISLGGEVDYRRDGKLCVRSCVFCMRENRKQVVLSDCMSGPVLHGRILHMLKTIWASLYPVMPQTNKTLAFTFFNV